MEKGHKIVFGAIVVSTAVILGALGGVASQKQNVQVVKEPVYITVKPTVASVSATPTVGVRKLPLRSALPTAKVTGQVK